LLYHSMTLRIVLTATALLWGVQAAAVEPYADVQLGYASAEWPRGAPLNGRIDDRTVAYGLNVGLAVTDRWAFQVGATDYGALDARGVPCAPGATCPPIVSDVDGTDISILSAAAVVRFRLGSVRLFAPFGFYRARVDTNLALPESRSRDRGVLLGLGARWYFRDPWHVSIQGTRFDDNLYQVMLGVGWGLRDRDQRERADRRRERGFRDFR
jgi:hypothetical protein